MDNIGIMINSFDSREITSLTESCEDLTESIKNDKKLLRKLMKKEQSEDNDIEIQKLKDSIKSNESYIEHFLSIITKLKSRIYW